MGRFFFALMKRLLSALGVKAALQNASSVSVRDISLVSNI